MAEIKDFSHGNRLCVQHFNEDFRHPYRFGERQTHIHEYKKKRKYTHLTSPLAGVVVPLFLFFFFLFFCFRLTLTKYYAKLLTNFPAKSKFQSFAGVVVENFIYCAWCRCCCSVSHSASLCSWVFPTVDDAYNNSKGRGGVGWQTVTTNSPEKRKVSPLKISMPSLAQSVMIFKDVTLSEVPCRWMLKMQKQQLKKKKNPK